jgi:hypothetical protein
VDSFRASCRITEENGSEARVPLDGLTRISEKTGTLFAVIHHARKPAAGHRGAAAGGVKMAVRGSGAIFDASGSVLVFAGEKKEPTTVSHEKARISGRTHDDYRLWINDVDIDGDPEGGLRVEYLPMPQKVKADAPADRFEEVKRKVFTLVQSRGRFQGGVNVIVKELGLRKDDVGAAVQVLERDGLIRNEGTRQKPVWIDVGTTQGSR